MLTRPPLPDPRPPGAADRHALPALLAAAVVPLIAYLFTLHPGLPAGDSGELISAAWTGGVAHPPGYPLWVMLAGAWAHALAFLGPAFALNLFSAVTMATAAGVLALAVIRLTGSRGAGVFAAWTFALSRPAWDCAVVAEVFALNALMGSLALWLLVRACPPVRPAAGVSAARLRAAARRAGGDAPPVPRGARPPAWVVPALAGVTVLAISHHHTLLLLGIPASVVAFTVAWREDTGRRAALLARTGTAKLLALLPLVWLPLASRRPGALVWGDAAGARGFLSLLLRDDYGTFRLDPLESGMRADRSHLVLWWQSLPHAFGWLPLALAVVGAIALGRTSRRIALALAGYAALQALFFTRIGFPSHIAWLRGVVERFHVLPALVLALLAGLGLAWLLARLPRGARTLAAALALAAAVTVPVLTLGPGVSQRGNRFTEALGEGVLASVPAHAVLFVQGDLPHNALAYLCGVRGRRPDVTVIDEELLTYSWYVRRVRAAHPDVLPPLGGAQRIVLRDGSVLPGWSIPRGDGTVDVLTENDQSTRPAADVVRVERVAPESLFAAARARFRTGWLRERSEDRYSGLPGTRSLLWLDHLAGKRPVAFVGTKDSSWSLRWKLTPVGFVALATPRDSTPGVPAQAATSLHVFAGTPMDAYFREPDPSSFEAAERWRFAAVASRAALVLSQPRAAGAIAAEPRGWGRMRAFAARFESLDPPPDPAALRAIGFLRLFGPGFTDHVLARRDLERYLASGAPSVAKDDEARATLERLRAGSRR